MSDGMLAIHPYAFLSVEAERDLIRLFCPIPGSEPRETRIERHGDAELFALLAKIATSDEAVAELECSEEHAEFLESAGFLIPFDTIDKVIYDCTLDPVLLELVPRRLIRLASRRFGGIINPTLAEEGIREDLTASYGPVTAELFPSERVWLDDPRTGQHVPFGASPVVEPLLSLCGAPAPAVDGDTAMLLRLAGVVADPTADAAEKARWTSHITAAQTAFAHDRYALVRDVLPPLHIAALRGHYRNLLAKGFFVLGDVQVERRYWSYQERIARFYHHLLAPLASQVAAQPVKPSYVYFASYLPGAILKRHTDRDQCEISISLLVDYVPEPDDVSDWPIYVESPSRPGVIVPIAQGLGDALFYKGCEVHHHRDALPEDHRSTSLFLHYVPEAFAGSLD